jgi:DNA-binding MarR family transcriptional regulator
MVKISAGTDEFLRRAVMIIIHIIRNLRSTSTDITFDVELTYPQNLALQALMENSPSTMSEFANWLKISHGVATRTVDRLVEKGLVERCHDEVDRRVVLVSLSETGRDYAEKIVASHLEKLGSVFETVSEDQRQAFMSLLEQIDRQLEE